MVNVQKSLKGASVKADFWHGKNIVLQKSMRNLLASNIRIVYKSSASPFFLPDFFS